MLSFFMEKLHLMYNESFCKFDKILGGVYNYIGFLWKFHWTYLV